MRSPNKKHTWVFILTIVFVAPFFFFSTDIKPWQSKSVVLTSFQELIYPIEYSWQFVKSSVVDNWNSYINLHNAAKENQEYKEKFAILEAKVIDYNHQINEVNRMRELLGFSKNFGRDIKIAEVINSSNSSPFQSIRISKGRQHDMQLGTPVVTANGVVGRAIRVGQFFTDVQLITDVSSNQDVIIERTRSRGVLQGIGHDKCRLRLHKRADIRIGDTIITSGIIGGFPKGLPVGRVVKISYEADDVSQVITIQPWVDFTQLEQVAILNQNDQNFDLIEETVGRNWIENNLKQSNILR